MSRQHRITMPARPATMLPQVLRRETLAIIDRGDFARISAPDRIEIIVAFVGSLSDAEVQAVGSKIDALAERRAA